MWIEAKTNQISKGVVLLAGQSYDVDQDTLDGIATANKAAGQPAFRYKKIPAPWDAKKDMASERVMELQSMLSKELAAKEELVVRLENLIAAMEAARLELCEYEKLNKSEVDNNPRLNAMRRLASARYEQATALVELCQMDTTDRKEGIDKLNKALGKEQGKTQQQAPADKQYHPGKDDRTK